MWWKTGLEPATLGITIRCSNQLSYIHHCFQILSDCVPACCTFARCLGAPDRNRTCNRRLRRPVLYPVELQARGTSLAHRSFPGHHKRALHLPYKPHGCANCARSSGHQLVGVEGFELSTSSSQSWRSTRLSYT